MLLLFCTSNRKLFASLQNAVDLKRIDQEKKLHQEMEREREHKKALAERAKLESQEKHDAVTVIAAKFRGNKARKYVAQKRAQKLLESALVGESQNVKAITTIQRFVRGSLTRIILLKCGFPRLWSFGSDAVNDTKRHRQGEIRRVLRASKGPDASAHIKVSAAQRCDVELFRRRYNDRCAIFEEMYRKHLSVQQVDHVVHLFDIISCCKCGYTYYLFVLTVSNGSLSSVDCERFQKAFESVPL